MRMLGLDGSTTTCGSTSAPVKLWPPMLPSSPSQPAIGLAPETRTSGPGVRGPAVAEPVPIAITVVNAMARAIRNLARIPILLWIVRKRTINVYRVDHAVKASLPFRCVRSWQTLPRTGADHGRRRASARRPARRPLLLPTPWDRGAARLLASLGFQALATTSSGHAATLGRLDGSVTREEALAHAASIVAATELPVSADLENAFADDPAAVATTVRLALDTGLARCSVEEFGRRPDAHIYDAGLAAERGEAG